MSGSSVSSRIGPRPAIDAARIARAIAVTASAIEATTRPPRSQADGPASRGSRIVRIACAAVPAAMSTIPAARPEPQRIRDAVAAGSTGCRWRRLRIQVAPATNGRKIAASSRTRPTDRRRMARRRGSPRPGSTGAEDRVGDDRGRGDVGSVAGGPGRAVGQRGIGVTSGGWQVLVVVVEGLLHQAGHVEDAEGLVRPRPGQPSGPSASSIASVDARAAACVARTSSRPAPGHRATGRLDPRPAGTVLGLELAEPSLPDQLLDGDQVPDDLARTPLAG